MTVVPLLIPSDELPVVVVLADGEAGDAEAAGDAAVEGAEEGVDPPAEGGLYCDSMQMLLESEKSLHALYFPPERRLTVIDAGQ